MSRMYRFALGTTWIVVAGAALLAGLDYYVLPLAERPWAPGHSLFSPTGVVGNRLGIAGSGMMTAGVALYAVRKRWEPLRRVGRLSDWLAFHIFLCTLGPFLVVLHTSFRVGGLVAIAFWSMVVVVVSGVLGRYVYVRIPKALDGRFRDMRELEEEQRGLVDAVRSELGPRGEAAAIELLGTRHPGPEPRGTVEALLSALRQDVTGFRDAARVRRLVGELPLEAGARQRLLRAVRRHRVLARQRALLLPLQRIFRYWHAFHLPLATVLFLVMAIHIGVAIAFGYGWTPAP